MVSFNTTRVDRIMQFGLKRLVTYIVLVGLFFIMIYYGVKNRTLREEPTHPQLAAGRKIHTLYIRSLTNTETVGSKSTARPRHCPSFPKFNITICIHDPKKDIWISSFLSKGNMWEAEQLNHLRTWLGREKSLTLIDIGANIGVFSLGAAGVGHKVLAVEPMPDNLDLLEASIAKSKLQNTITVVPLALSDGYHNMSLETDVTNQGKTVLKSEPCIPSDKIACRWTNTIKLDDLLSVPNFIYNNSVMKIDIEGHEIPTMMAGVKFWQEVHIPVIMMEWMWVPLKFKDGSLSVKKITEYLDFMTKLKYTPLNVANGKPLQRSLWKTWPTNIVWSQPGFKF